MKTTSPSRTSGVIALALSCSAALALSACGGGGASSASPAAAPSAPSAAAAPSAQVAAADEAPQASQAPGATGSKVTITDDGCTVDTKSFGTGTVTFAVTNTGKHDTEFYFIGGQGLVEEAVPPGQTVEIVGQAPTPGAYEAKCKIVALDRKSVNTLVVPLTVTGEAITAAAGSEAAAAGKKYADWVNAQLVKAYPQVEAFADAVIAGDRAAAKKAYAASRGGWERVEPVAESFGDLDPRMDARDGDLEEGQTWGGWHRLEKAVWSNEKLEPLAPIARQLEADYEELMERAKKVTLTPAQIAAGSKELLDEVSRGKLTGEEDRYSHTDLYDIEANIEGAHEGFEILEGIALAKDPALEEPLDAAYDKLVEVLAKHKKNGAFVGFDTLSKADVQILTAAVDAFGEQISRLGAAVTP